MGRSQIESGIESGLDLRSGDLGSRVQPESGSGSVEGLGSIPIRARSEPDPDPRVQLFGPREGLERCPKFPYNSRIVSLGRLLENNL